MRDSNSKFSPDLLAQTVLLEQYRLLLARQNTIPILGRVLSFMTIAFVAISTHLSLVQSGAAVLVSIAITYTWSYELRLVSRQARNLADDLARKSGDEEEDFYIKSQYNIRKLVSARSPTSCEPLLWLALTISLSSLQFLFTVQLGHSTGVLF
jgi:hypothetical protein